MYIIIYIYFKLLIPLVAAPLPRAKFMQTIDILLPRIRDNNCTYIVCSDGKSAEEKNPKYLLRINTKFDYSLHLCAAVHWCSFDGILFFKTFYKNKKISIKATHVQVQSALLSIIKI